MSVPNIHPAGSGGTFEGRTPGQEGHANDLDSRYWSLIDPSSAQRFRILPMGHHDDTIVILTDAAVISEPERKERAAKLAYWLGFSAGELRSIHDPNCPIDQSQFNSYMHDWYGDLKMPKFATFPVSTELMHGIVLWLDSNARRAGEWQRKLQAEGPFQVAHVMNVDAAITEFKKHHDRLRVIVAEQPLIAALKAALGGKLLVPLKGVEEIVKMQDPVEQLLQLTPL